MTIKTVTTPKARRNAPARPSALPVDHIWCSFGQHWTHRGDFSIHKERSTDKQTNCRTHQVQAVEASNTKLAAIWTLPANEQRRKEVIRLSRTVTKKPVTGGKPEWRRTILSLTPKQMTPKMLRKTLLLVTAQQAQAAQVPFELTESDLFIFANVDPITGAPMHRTTRRKQQGGMRIVRIDKALGFVRGNVVTLTEWAALNLHLSIAELERDESQYFHLAIARAAQLRKPWGDEEDGRWADTEAGRFSGRCRAMADWKLQGGTLETVLLGQQAWQVPPPASGDRSLAI